MHYFIYYRSYREVLKDDHDELDLIAPPPSRLPPRHHSGRFNSRDFARFRILRQVFEQVQRLVHTAGLAGMGRPYNELPLLQLQRQHERQEDKARLRVQSGLLPGPDSQRQRGFPQTEQTQFRPEAGNASRQLPGAARPGGLGAAVLASLLQRYDSSVSKTRVKRFPRFTFIVYA